MKVLVIDIGGTNVKLMMAGKDGVRKFRSGKRLTPQLMVTKVIEAARPWKYNVISLGFPGPVKHGRPMTEPENLGPGWVDFDFAEAFGKPVRIMNDAAMQALGSYDGGRMLFLGLGTGLGSSLVVDGRVVGMELGLLRYTRRRDFAYCMADSGLRKFGRIRWEKLVIEIVELLKKAFLPDYVVLGGGNAKRLRRLPDGVRRGDNRHAFLGGTYLWIPPPHKQEKKNPAKSSAGPQ